MTPPSIAPREAPHDEEHDENGLSPEARAALEAGLESARREPSVCLGSFAQYAYDTD